MKRFIIAERDAARFDLSIYDGAIEPIMIKNVLYYEVVAQVEMRLRPDDVIVYAFAQGFPWTQTGEEYVRMKRWLDTAL